MAKFSLLAILGLDSSGFTRGLKGAGRDTDIFKNKLAEGFKSVSNFYNGLIGLGTGFIALTAGSEAFMSVVNSTEQSQDEWNRTVAQGVGITNSFKTALIQMDFKNLISGLSDTLKLAKEYALFLETIDDKEVNLSITRATLETQISDLKLKAAGAKDEKDREFYLKQILILEQKISDERLKVATDKYTGKRDFISQKVGIKPETLEKYLYKSTESTAIEDKAMSYKKMLTDEKNLTFVLSQAKGDAWTNTYNALQKVQNQIKNTSAEVIDFYKIMTNAESKPEVTNDLRNDFLNLQTIIQETNAAKLKPTKQLTGLENKSDKKDKKEDSDILKERNKLTEDFVKLATKESIIIKKTSREYNEYGEAIVKATTKGIGNVKQLDTMTYKLAAFNEKLGFDKIADYTSQLALGFEGIGVAIGGATGAWIKYVSNVVAMMPSIIAQIIALTSAKKADALTGAVAAAASVPFPLNIVSLAASVAAVVAALATIPKFETGGIVGGHSFSGDKLFARVNSGEMFLNQKQQNNLLALTSGNGYGEVRFEIEGDKLYGVLKNYNRKINKFI